MIYPLGAITSLSGGNLTVNGNSNTYFSVLQEDDEITLNKQTVAVNTAYSDSEFTVKTAIISGTSGDIVYTTSKCIWLRYQIWKIDSFLVDYDLKLSGVKKVKNTGDELEFNNNRTTIAELMKLRNNYQVELERCEAESNDDSAFLLRRYETGTL